MRQVIYIGLSVVAIAVTVLIFNMAHLLKRSLGAGDELADSLHQLLRLTEQRDGEQAHTMAEDLSLTWQRVRG